MQDKNTQLGAGDEVIFLLPATHPLHTADGTIRNINGNEVKVEIPANYAHLLEGGHRIEGTFTTLALDQVQKISLPDYPERWARRLYGNDCGSVFPLSYQLNPRNGCMHKGCKERSTVAILYKNNIEHIVAEYYVCKEHAHMHGRSGGPFIMDKDYKPKVKIYSPSVKFKR